MANIITPLYDAARKAFLYWSGSKYVEIPVSGEGVGDLSRLNTQAKDSAVSAINEVYAHSTRNDDITAMFGSPIGLVIGTGTYVKVPANPMTGNVDPLTNEDAYFNEVYGDYYTLRDGKRVTLKYPSLNFGNEIELFDADGNFTMTKQNLPQGVYFTTNDNCYTFQMTPGMVVSAFSGSPDLGFGDSGKILGVVIDDVPRLVRQLGDIDLVNYAGIPDSLAANKVLYALNWLIMRATAYVDSTINNVNVNDMGILDSIPADIPANHSAYFGYDVGGGETHKFVLQSAGTEEGYKPIAPNANIFTITDMPPIPADEQFYRFRFPENIDVDGYIGLNPNWNQSFKLFLTINQDLNEAAKALSIEIGGAFFKGYRSVSMYVQCDIVQEYPSVMVFDNSTSRYSPDTPGPSGHTWDDIASIDIGYKGYIFRSDKTTREFWVEDGNGNPVPLTFLLSWWTGDFEETKRDYFVPSANFAAMTNHVHEIYGIREAFEWVDSGEPYVSELHQDRDGIVSYQQYTDILSRLAALETAR